MKPITKALIPTALLFVLLLMAQIMYSSMLVGDGKEIKVIDNQIDVARQQVLLNEEKVASASSLTTIREQAVAMGFESAPKVVTMQTDSLVVAFGQSR